MTILKNKERITNCIKYMTDKNHMLFFQKYATAKEPNAKMRLLNR
jgi:hypothetical protein